MFEKLPYNLEQARNGVNKMREKMKSAKTADYPKTEKSLGEKEKRLKKIEIPGLGEISYFEKKVMFPERIIEETDGVRGYVRKMIPWEEFGKFCGIESPEELRKILEIFIKYEKYNDSLNQFNSPLSKTDYDIEKNKFIDKHKNEINQGIKFDKIFDNDRVYQILEKLTEGKFPGKAFPDGPLTHVFCGFILNDSSEFVTKFKEQKTMLQTLFPLDNDYRGTSYSIFSIKNKKIIPWEDYFKNLFKDIGLPEEKYSSYFKEQMRIYGSRAEFSRLIFNNLSENEKKNIFQKIKGDKNISLLSLQGLSLEHKFDNAKKYFWLPNLLGRSNFFENSIFGFGLKNKAFRKYNEKVNDLLSTLDDSAYNSEENGIDFLGIGKLTTKLLSQGPFKNEKGNLVSADEIDSRYGTQHDDASHHPHVPVVLGHPDIPELRWCYADYAAIPTKNGYNVLEMITDEEDDDLKKESKD